MDLKKFHGVVPAMATPFTAEERFDEGRARELIEWYLASGVHGISVANVKKHKGITTFLVDLKSPGISMRRIPQITGHPAFCEVFYDNVRVPRANLLGAVNEGWGVALFGVATEKSFGYWLINSGRRDLEMLIEYCRETRDVDGRLLCHDPLIRSRLAQLAIDLEVGRNLGMRLNWMATRGMPIVAAACQLKPFGGNIIQRLGHFGVQTLGLYGQLDEALQVGQAERPNEVSLFGRGGHYH